MACAQCSIYVPEESSRAQMPEAEANLQRMLKEISLTEEEIVAVESGIEFMNQLCRWLTDVPTPDGSAPRELSVITRRKLTILPAFKMSECNRLLTHTADNQKRRARVYGHCWRACLSRSLDGGVTSGASVVFNRRYIPDHCQMMLAYPKAINA